MAPVLLRGYVAGGCVSFLCPHHLRRENQYLANIGVGTNFVPWCGAEPTVATAMLQAVINERNKFEFERVAVMRGPVYWLACHWRNA